MTPLKSGPTNVVVVDGSNIATEGRSMPSLTQLNEAVMAFTEEFPDATVTVVVDATFGHRIDKKELTEFDAAIAHNELVAPPAGAIGRGDAFVLSIANKVGARILSNDSFQEFHGDYPWLFDEGRLIGGKPVPFVGWVFVERLPVKGAISRKATRSARGGREREPRPARRTASKEASLPMPVPTAPPPGGRRARNDRREPAIDPVAELVAPERAPVPSSGGGPVNDLLPFLDFVEHHPAGSSVNGVVESYSSHGAYVAIGDVRGYVPLRLMGDPPPRSAREVMKLGDAVTLVVTSFAPARRSVDLSIPKVATVTEVVPTPGLEELAQAVERPARKRASRKAPAAAGPAAEPTVADAAPAEPAPAKRSVARKQAPAKKAPAKKAPAKKAPAKKAAAKKAPAKQVAAKKAAAKRAPSEQVVAEPEVAEQVATEQAPPRKARGRKAATAQTETVVIDGVPVDGTAVVERASAKRPVRKRAADPVMDPLAEGV